jgi:hypothetical protein
LPTQRLLDPTLVIYGRTNKFDSQYLIFYLKLKQA